MVKEYCPFLSRVWRKRFTALTFSLLVGLGGAVGCSDDEPSADEPVKAEAAQSGEADQAAVAELEGGEKSEAAAPAETTEAKSGDDDAAKDAPSENTETASTQSDDTQTAATDGEAPTLPQEQESDAMLADAQANGGEKVTETETNTTDTATETAEADTTDKTTETPTQTKTKTNYAPQTTATTSEGGDGTYTVTKGDTLGEISQKIYGSAHLWNMLATNNGIAAPYTIHPGQTIKYEVTNDQSKSFASNGGGGGGSVGNGPGQSVTVKRGDTLSGIAHRVYGNAARWPTIFAHNKDKITDPNTIEVGMVLFCSGSGGGTENADENDSTPVTKKSAHTHNATGKKTVKTNWHKKKITGH